MPLVYKSNRSRLRKTYDNLEMTLLELDLERLRGELFEVARRFEMIAQDEPVPGRAEVYRTWADQAKKKAQKICNVVIGEFDVVNDMAIARRGLDEEFYEAVPHAPATAT